ncbi:CAP family protein [Hexamita inflata]|uniref:CAP family protein n=1 Tax=Hexamita inflata TaxID=28002 RepID=A0AA86QQI2_9EUKA|nr:CAP family protein [Hexamita inflata]
MAEQIESIVITERRAIPERDLRTQILEAMREDAHRQKSHREIDQYLSQHQSSYLITVMLQSLNTQPTDPFWAMAERLKVPADLSHPDTVLGGNVEEMMKRDPLFSQLDPDVFLAVQQSLIQQEYKANQQIFAKGSKAATVALVSKGSVVINNQVVNAGHFISKSAVYPNSVHTFDISSGPSGCTLHIISQDQIEKIVFEDSIRATYTRKTDFQSTINHKFKSMSQVEVSFLAQLSEPFVFPKGEILAKKGTVQNKIFVVTECFNQQDADNQVELMCSNQQKLKVEYKMEENGVKNGDVIGAEGVLIGREEKRDWICQGIVQGYWVSAESLKLRQELMSKMKKDVE